MLYTKNQFVELGIILGVNNNIIKKFLETPEEFYGNLAFPFYLQQKLENPMEASVIKYYPKQNIFLNEWRRFVLVDDRVRTDAVHRQIYQLNDIKHLITKGFSWTLNPRPAYAFELDRALNGDYTGFERSI